jgi:hypothetical protein
LSSVMLNGMETVNEPIIAFRLMHVVAWYPLTSDWTMVKVSDQVFNSLRYLLPERTIGPSQMRVVFFVVGLHYKLSGSLLCVITIPWMSRFQRNGLWHLLLE